MQTMKNRQLSELLKQTSLPKLRWRQQPNTVFEEANKILNRWPDVENTDSDLDAVELTNIMVRRYRNNDWEGFYWMDVTRTACAFFGDGLWKNQRFDSLNNFIIDQIVPGVNGPFLRAMFEIYLKTFDPKSTKLTRPLAGKFKNCWQDLNLPVDFLIQEFQLFDIDEVPHQKIANYMDDEPKPFEALRKMGVAAPHGPGLMELAHHSFVSRIVPQIQNGEIESVKKLLDWLDPGGETPPLQGEAAARAVDTLLLPWLMRDPDQELKAILENRLVRAYGDARVSDVGVWRACSDRARQIILKWLAGTTIREFFEIITITNRSHMWHNRKSFWINLYEENRILEGWFALSPAAEEAANNLNRNRNDVKLEFGKNCSTGNDRKKSLLIMKINDRWVIEGSHNFPTWVFPPGSLLTLKPYQTEYTCRQIRTIEGPEKPERIVHSYHWRNNVLNALN